MGRFITEWAWEDDRKPEPIGEGTLLFFDRGQDDHDGGPVLVGFVAWSIVVGKEAASTDLEGVRCRIST